MGTARSLAALGRVTEGSFKVGGPPPPPENCKYFLRRKHTTLTSRIIKGKFPSMIVISL